LPEYMVPAAFVPVDTFPLTPNGKLDRRALPSPEADAYRTGGYTAPQGEIEKTLAALWAEVLQVEQIGRHDNFFELGGHSLLALRLVERMRSRGLLVDVRTLFRTPTLADLAKAVGSSLPTVEIPPNLIPPRCDAIKPEMLPLVHLSVEEIQRIVGRVSGGAANVQDIYPLAPLQEGILFHHLMGGEGDPYLLASQIAFDTRARLEAYLRAMRAVIDRHDILRTAVIWEGLAEPVQVVWRTAVLPVEEVVLDRESGDAAKQLYERFSPRRQRIDVQHAPLLRVYIAYDPFQDRWLMMKLLHHLAGDHTTLEVMREEIQAHLLGQADRLPAALPFRNLVARARLGVSREEHEAFFRQMLGNVEEVTAPFGLINVRGDGTGIEEARLALSQDLARRIRECARKFKVTAASLFHLGWARLLAKLSEREDVVFGTVLFGRMQGGEGADRVMGLFMNTLPVRISVGEGTVDSSVRSVHSLLTDLLRHEHASLALAQRCSGVAAPTPLFSALLNYRHSAGVRQASSEKRNRLLAGIRGLYGEERTNYPLMLSVDDLGDGFSLTAQIERPIAPRRICEYMNGVLESLVNALETSPDAPVYTLKVLGKAERRQVLYEWNDTAAEFPSDACIHELFEVQVEKSPDGIAVVHEERELSYRELNRAANQLAHYLRELGVAPDARVAICLERGLEMIIALLAVLKAGGAYVPLDPSYPPERLRFMLEDSAPAAVVTQAQLRGLIQLPQHIPVVDLTEAAEAWQQSPESNPDRVSIGLTPEHLAYVIYTSGSTGQPKGVMVEHRSVVNLLSSMLDTTGIKEADRLLSVTTFAFDIAALEIYMPLLCGAQLFLVSSSANADPIYLASTMEFCAITIMQGTPAIWRMLLDSGWRSPTRLKALCGGEALPSELARRLENQCAALWNMYGPTETTIWSASLRIDNSGEMPNVVPLGRPIANTQLYVLDARGEPVPVGVTGELYIGGAGVARGYFNRPELSAERFLRDPFSREPGARMYRTGDLGRWLPHGDVEFLGRNDSQVKIRGFRIELAEIEARLKEDTRIRDAVVTAREDTPGDKRLAAYYTLAENETSVEAAELRSQLLAVLPDYMVPAAFVPLDALPLTPNGKLDRKALPSPAAYATRTYEAPQGETEAMLATVWAEVLRLDKVGRHDNFFELGGHSLTAVQVIAKLPGELAVELTLRDLFNRPVLSNLAEHIINSQLENFDPEDMAKLVDLMGASQ
jgi:amino acid adenylation domain-containing protein